MSMTKTLGGDRVGSGGKMKVHLHNYERSTHNLGYIWRSTMSAGTLVPFLNEVALPGDTFDINLDCDMKTHPTVGPLFGTYKVQLDVYLCPIRLYNSLLHNNALGIGLNMSQVKLPVLELTAPETASSDLDNAQINPSCILSYLGIRGIGHNPLQTEATRQFNAVPFLAYWDIYKNYYANKMEEIGAVIHNATANVNKTVTDIKWNDIEIPQDPAMGNVQIEAEFPITVTFPTAAATPAQDTIIFLTVEHGELTMAQLCTSVVEVTGPTENKLVGTYNWQKYGNYTNIVKWRYITSTDIVQGKPQIVTFPLANIDEMRQRILSYHSLVDPFVVTGIQPYGFITETSNDTPVMLTSQEGLALKTYQSDLFNNWLKTEFIEGPDSISAITAISTVGDQFTLDTLNLSKKVYNMLNRIAVSGGTYDDWLDAVYTHDRYKRAETPMYMGGLIKELVFQEVVSNAKSEDQKLGTLAGKGVLSRMHKGGNVVVKVDEPSIILGLISLTPRLDYSQGNKWSVHLKTLDDLHKPALDEIGFQDLITEQMAWWDTSWDGTNWTQRSAGKQPAWINYMTNVNETRGNFAIGNGDKVGEMFMTLNRRYEPSYDTGELRIQDLTTYIDPSKFNNIFADRALDSQNFWAQVAVDITARRKMSAKIMPNL